MASITFLQTGQTIDAPDNSELLQIFKDNPGLPLRFGCTQGECGVCTIRVARGENNLSPCTRRERMTLAQKNKAKGCRLACQCAVRGDITLS